MSRSGQEPGFPAGRRGRGGWRSRRWRGPTVVIVLAVVMLMPGCGDGRTGDREEGLTPGKFVEVVSGLREAERAVAGEDSAAALFAERKSEILAREGVTEPELHAFVSARDASELEGLWEAIARRLRYVPDAGEPLRGIPDGEDRDAPPSEPRDEAPGEPGDEPAADSRPEALRRGPSSLPAPPVPADTGERRLH